MFHQSLSGQWTFRQQGTNEWLSATVPGGVHTDLLALGKIPDPFVADYEKQVQWVAETDWEYCTTFQAAPALLKEARQYLVCDGLDTLAEVSLNGILLGKTDNMYRQWKWDVTGALRAGANEISILFSAPVTFITAKQKEKALRGGGDIPGGPHLRKAPCQWGWDWGPKLPPIGIWKDIRLEGYSSAKFEDVHVRQKHEGGKVRVSAAVQVESWKDESLWMKMTLLAPDGSSQTTRVGVADKAEAVIDVDDPQLWWPNGCGKQNLYQLQITLETETSTLDWRNYQIGLRTIELKQEPDEWGESFTFFVNGLSLFAKGADWIPADSFPTRISDEHLEYLIKSARDAHMNMLRVWGGGLYEGESFYDLCDRYGILIWQDFTFACGVYPEDDAFAENVRIEAIENVRRLRHRASLALWCGNNEMEQGWSSWDWNKPEDPANQRLKMGYDRMYHHLLPAVVAGEDPDRVYWPSSASSGIPFADPNGMQRGDMHYWEVWHGRKPFTAYRTQFPRFMSEFGFQALPPYKTIQTYAAPEDQNMTSYIMEHHQRNAAGNGLIIGQMTDTFRMPKDFPSLVYLSMLLQAEGIRYGVEHWRRNRHRVGGTLIWQLNDCWPVASWSSLDYFGRWKALHYAAKRFYAPILLSVEDDSTRMSIHVTSDLTQDWDGLVRWRLEELSGAAILSGENRVDARPLADTLIQSFDFADKVSDANKRNVLFVAELWQGDEKIATSVSSFAPLKHLALTDPGLNVDVSLDGDTLTFDVSAQSLARFVELALDGVDVVFSDNYFDLPAGTSTKITAPLPTGWTLDQAKTALQVRSLIDSYR
ncbi:MAG TPA: glycoside hydrolase family 2 protein [Anaerolineales bacterium]|nr:glycoside hydrolase family 2 protein [Anaerolineales bacterium]